MGEPHRECSLEVRWLWCLAIQGLRTIAASTWLPWGQICHVGLSPYISSGLWQRLCSINDSLTIQATPFRRFQIPGPQLGCSIWSVWPLVQTKWSIYGYRWVLNVGFRHGEVSRLLSDFSLSKCKNIWLVPIDNLWHRSSIPFAQVFFPNFSGWESLWHWPGDDMVGRRDRWIQGHGSDRGRVSWNHGTSLENITISSSQGFVLWQVDLQNEKFQRCSYMINCANNFFKLTRKHGVLLEGDTCRIASTLFHEMNVSWPHIMCIVLCFVTTQLGENRPPKVKIYWLLGFLHCIIKLGFLHCWHDWSMNQL